MKPIIRAVEQIRTIPGAKVDCGLGQGREKFLAFVHKQTTEVWKIPVMQDDWYIEEDQRIRAEVEHGIEPHHLPSDYAFFLEYYCGLVIDRDDYRFCMYGIGLMSEEWYSYLIGDEFLFEAGFLKIAYTVPRDGKENFLVFFLDLAGNIHSGCVIAIAEKDIGEIGITPILIDPKSFTGYWYKLADSFTDWIVQAAITKGKFDLP